MMIYAKVLHLQTLISLLFQREQINVERGLIVDIAEPIYLFGGLKYQAGPISNGINRLHKLSQITLYL